MPGWWSSLGGQWLGWTIAFAVAAWVVEAVAALLEPRRSGPRLTQLVAAATAVLPPVLAFLIGLRFGSWWWLLGPPLAIALLTLPALIYRQFHAPPAARQQAGAGLALALIFTAVQAGLAVLAAAAGVLISRLLAGA